MASPQLEEGHLRISTEFYDALCRIRIPGEARQVFDFVIRKTWGWQKREDKIPLSQFVLGTGLRKDKVIRARRKLVEMNIIRVSQKGNDEAPTYSINKDFDSWKSFPKKETFPKKEMIISQKGNASFPKKEPSIDTSSKDTTKDNLSGFAEFWEAYPKKVSIGLAERTWKKLKPTEQLQGQILAALERAKTSVWAAKEKRYIPNPSTWLNAKGWLDEMEMHTLAAKPDKYAHLYE